MMKSIKLGEDGKISFEVENEEDIQNVKELMDLLKGFGGEEAVKFGGAREGEPAENNAELLKVINETFNGGGQ